MAITTAVCTSFKNELAQGVHNFTTDSFKLALYTNNANLDESTTQYTASGEVVGQGYVSGGKAVNNLSVSISGSTILMDFDDIVWTNASFTTRGALLFNTSKSNKAVAVWNFGSDKSAAGTDFTIIVPSATVGSAILRIA